MTDFNFERLQGESKFRHLVRLSIAKLNKEHNTDWLELVDMFGLDYSAETLRKKSYGWKDFVENEEIEQLNSEEEITYKETTEILANGSHKSDKLIKMSSEQSKDINYILEAHGFDSESWELVNAKNNIWNVNSKTKGVQTLYSSKITVKPKENGFDFNKLLEVIERKVQPITVKKEVVDEKEYDRLLEIPLFDMHFGVNDLEYYIPHMNKIVEKITSRKWDTVIFVIGQDVLHNNDFKGHTANGTPIEKVDMVKAFDDALRFYTTIITYAVQNSKNVKCMYSKGNHDESSAYGLFRTIQATFRNENVEFEGSLDQFKAFKWKDVFIGITHGDKANSRIFETYIIKFGKLIADSKVRTIHSGHLHVENVKNKMGLTHRTLSTANQTDEWHAENGFLDGVKTFQIFEYSSDKLDSIYYI